MKKLNKLFLWLCIFFLMPLIFTIGGCKPGGSGDKSGSNALLVLGAGLNNGTPLTVITTNDRHSRYLGRPYDTYNPTVTGDGTMGGISRLAVLYDNARAANPDTLVVDAGDFIDGTIFIAAENGAGDLNALSYLGYDAACLGNHEMGMGPEGLAQMISAAKKDASGKMTPLLCANINFSSADTTLGHSDDALEAQYGNEGEAGKYIFPYIIRTTSSGTRVGIFGLMGAQVSMPDAKPCTFDIDYAEIQNLVDGLRNDDDKKVDVVLCLIHAGFNVTGAVPGGETASLAKNVSGIDLICAGHSHVKANAKVPCEVPSSGWTTTIIEAGDTTENAGIANIFMKEGTVNPSTTVEQQPMDDTIIGISEINDKLDDFISDIEANYLASFTQLKDGHLFDVLAHSDFNFGQLNSMNMVTDAMRSASTANVALCTPGADTASVSLNAADDITVYDAFAAMPHCMGRDGLHGGPLYKFNLLAAEVQGILELGTCNMGQGNPDLFVLPSGVKIIFNTSDLRAGTGPGYIIKMYLTPPDELTQTLIFDRSDTVNFPYGGWKYAPGTNGGPGDPYQFLSVSATALTLIGLKDISESDGGAGIELWPRNGVGAPVTWNHISELDTFLVKDGGNEVKAWYSVAEYIASFAGGSVPQRYNDAYTDGSTNNPIGPAWRRVWDVAEYGMP